VLFRSCYAQTGSFQPRQFPELKHHPDAADAPDDERGPDDAGDFDGVQLKVINGRRRKYIII
jgi:hypothetical protein